MTARVHKRAFYQVNLEATHFVVKIYAFAYIHVSDFTERVKLVQESHCHLPQAVNFVCAAWTFFLIFRLFSFRHLFQMMNTLFEICPGFHLTTPPRLNPRLCLELLKLRSEEIGLESNPSTTYTQIVLRTERFCDGWARGCDGAD